MRCSGRSFECRYGDNDHEDGDEDRDEAREGQPAQFVKLAYGSATGDDDGAHEGEPDCAGAVAREGVEGDREAYDAGACAEDVWDSISVALLIFAVAM